MDDKLSIDMNHVFPFWDVFGPQNLYLNELTKIFLYFLSKVILTLPRSCPLQSTKGHTTPIL